MRLYDGGYLQCRFEVLQLLDKHLSNIPTENRSNAHTHFLHHLREEVANLQPDLHKAVETQAVRDIHYD